VAVQILTKHDMRICPVVLELFCVTRHTDRQTGGWTAVSVDSLQGCD